jgi:hypothetical protein
MILKDQTCSQSPAAGCCLERLDTTRMGSQRLLFVSARRIGDRCPASLLGPTGSLTSSIFASAIASQERFYSGTRTNLTLFLSGQGVENFSQMPARPSQQHLAPSLGNEHHVVSTAGGVELFCNPAAFVQIVARSSAGILTRSIRKGGWCRASGSAGNAFYESGDFPRAEQAW